MNDSPDKKEISQIDDNKRLIPRRLILKAVAGLGISAVIGHIQKRRAFAPHIPLQKDSNPEIQPISKNLEYTSVELKSEQKDDEIALLNSILKTPLNTSERVYAENLYVYKVTNFYPLNLENLDKGLWVIHFSALRELLLQRRFEIRQSGHEKLTKLPEEKISWAHENEIDPEVLGICIDAYQKAKPILGKLLENPKQFRPDLLEELNQGNIFIDLQTLTPEQIIPNPGLLAKLVMTETSGFKNIGEGKAIENIDIKVFPDAPNSLVKLCSIIRQKTGLSFDPNNIPGSKRVEGTISGGAISIQIMPDNVLNIYKLVKEKTGVELNIFDPTDSVVIAIIFLTMGEEIETENGKDFRYGYIRGDFEKDGVNILETIRAKSLEKWNPHQEQKEIVLNSGNDYYDKFLKDGKYYF